MDNAWKAYGKTKLGGWSPGNKGDKESPPSMRVGGRHLGKPHKLQKAGSTPVFPATMKKLMEIIGNPYYLRRFHGYSTMFWIPFTLLAFLLGWLQSVIFVSFVSMIALFLGSFSSWQASRTEVAQDELNDTAEDKRMRLQRTRPNGNVIPKQLRPRRSEHGFK